MLKELGLGLGLGSLLLIGCGGGGTGGGAISAQPLTGKIGGKPWTFVTGETS